MMLEDLISCNESRHNNGTTQRKTKNSYFHFLERALFVFKIERDRNFANAPNMLTLYFHVGKCL